LGQGCFFARGPGGRELVAGLVVGAAEGILVARELDEGVVFAVPKEGDTKEAGFLVVALLADGAGRLGGGVGAIHDLAGAFHAVGVQAALDADHAAETPVGPGHLAEAELLGLVDGLEGGAEAVEEGLEFGGVLVGEEGVAGGEVVGAAVAGDFGFALGGAWAGGELGVTAVGVDLQLGRHGAPRGERRAVVESRPYRKN
jgi:hypothetical protein